MEIAHTDDGPSDLESVAAGDHVAVVLEELATLAVRQVSTPRDISLTAVSTLAHLDRNGPTRLTALAVEQAVSQPSMTQLVQRLEREGLVCRRTDRRDARATRIALTEAGRKLLGDRRSRRRERLAMLLDEMSPEERRALVHAAETFLPLLHRLLAGSPAP
ncbi:MarR family winged helix-turn-helix transcriptional regulator [Sphaerimonospora thailandensis]|uniref:MarR family transcriptional regulator n=1 Tax=Sphaerimonospora thailandensis TaxID=795644 RepID=A0A8J3R656_9ACTN|nr:MarR family winged helix-turn-helix transcriptional regulator [Sphaerimonospora thailandensis]GIH69832.1 MarR family transcriptional regulator [Sphaerimonospora thailandensis]